MRVYLDSRPDSQMKDQSGVVLWFRGIIQEGREEERAITLDNHLVVLATTAADAGPYHVEAVNEITGENVTSPTVYLSISEKKEVAGMLPEQFGDLTDQHPP
ncbi:hypothetical protein CRENBAI_021675 [Crenichthys baileyi]|uniref:Immunoglobulin I-set domain-containing protein n=1 Tax=Crenichthys baileyi TaxID=28760 RepID=A0AAV9RBR1_9TELE